MAVELRNWLEGELQVDLPIVELMRSPSVSGLADLLADRLETARGSTSTDAGRDAAAIGPAHSHNGTRSVSRAERSNEWPQGIDDLSGDEVDALLAALWARKAMFMVANAVTNCTAIKGGGFARGPVARREARIAGTIAPGKIRAVGAGLSAVTRPAGPVVPSSDGLAKLGI